MEKRLKGEDHCLKAQRERTRNQEKSEEGEAWPGREELQVGPELTTNALHG